MIEHGGDAPGLLRYADRALYTAKSMARNRVVVGSMDTSSLADRAGWPDVVDEVVASDEANASGRN